MLDDPLYRIFSLWISPSMWIQFTYLPMFIFLLVEFFFLVMRKLSSTFLVPEFTNCKNRGILIRTEQLTPKFFVEIFKTLCFISTSNFNSSFVACPLKYLYSEILDILQLFLSCIFYERNKIVGCTPNKT